LKSSLLPNPFPYKLAKNSDAELRWKYGRRNVLDATSQRGPNQRKSARGVKGLVERAVRTVLIEGSVWSMEVLFWEENFVRSYWLR